MDTVIGTIATVAIQQQHTTNTTTAPLGSPSSVMDYTLTAICYSAFTSSGFFVAVLLAWALLSIFSTAGNRRSGNFGKLMMLIEAVDALPEAMVIAGAAEDGTITLQFAASIFLLNIVNTLATALDFLATRPEKFFHRIMVVMIFFSVGSLFFSVSSTLFAGFFSNVRDPETPIDYMLLFPIFAGVMCGVCLVWIILLLEYRYSPEGRRHRGRRHVSDVTDTATEDEGIAIEMDDTEALLRSHIQREQSIIQKMNENDSVRASRDAAHTIDFYRGRLDAMQQLVESSQQAKKLSETLDLPITDDARDIIEDALQDRAGMLHGEGLVMTETPGTESLRRRAMKLLLIMLALSAWTVLLTFALTPLFTYLDSRFQSSYISGFADGLSGGAFLSLISSTMIPRIQQDAYRSHWSKIVFKSVGMFAFVAGVGVSFVLGFLPAPGQM